MFPKFERKLWVCSDLAAFSREDSVHFGVYSGMLQEAGAIESNLCGVVVVVVVVVVAIGCRLDNLSHYVNIDCCCQVVQQNRFAVFTESPAQIVLRKAPEKQASS